MRNKTLIIFAIFLIYSFNLFSQDLVKVKIDKINKLIVEISENENNVNYYNYIHTDGVIATKKRFLGVFKITISKGGFAETYMLKDSNLVCLTIGSREYLSKDKNQSTNKVEQFFFDNEKLCYYSETMQLENKGKQDSLIYKIDYQIDNTSLIKVNKIGLFKHEDEAYSKELIKNSLDKIENKNMMIK